MNHDEIRSKLNAFFDCALAPAETGEIREHFASCDACRDEVSAWERIRTAFFHEPEPKPSESFVFRVMESVRKEASFDLFQFFRWLVPTGILMFTALLLISTAPINADETFAYESVFSESESPFAVQEFTARQSDLENDWAGLGLL